MVGKGSRAIVPLMPNPTRKTRFTSSECQNRCFPTTIIRPTGALFVLCLVALGCDRNIEPHQPGEEPRQPDLARIFPGPPGGAGSAEIQGENEGATPRGAVPPARAEAAPDVLGIRLYVEEGNAAAMAAYEDLGMQAASYRFYEASLGRAGGADRPTTP